MLRSRIRRYERDFGQIQKVQETAAFYARTFDRLREEVLAEEGAWFQTENTPDWRDMMRFSRHLEPVGQPTEEALRVLQYGTLFAEDGSVYGAMRMQGLDGRRYITGGASFTGLLVANGSPAIESVVAGAALALFVYASDSEIAETDLKRVLEPTQVVAGALRTRANQLNHRLSRLDMI